MQKLALFYILHLSQDISKSASFVSINFSYIKNKIWFYDFCLFGDTIICTQLYSSVLYFCLFRDHSESAMLGDHLHCLVIYNNIYKKEQKRKSIGLHAVKRNNRVDRIVDLHMEWSMSMKPELSLKHCWVCLPIKMKQITWLHALSLNTHIPSQNLFYYYLKFHLV